MVLYTTIRCALCIEWGLARRLDECCRRREPCSTTLHLIVLQESASTWRCYRALRMRIMYVHLLLDTLTDPGSRRSVTGLQHNKKRGTTRGATTKQEQGTATKRQWKRGLSGGPVGAQREGGVEAAPSRQDVVVECPRVPGGIYTGRGVTDIDADTSAWADTRCKGRGCGQRVTAGLGDSVSCDADHARCNQPTSKPVIMRMFSGYAELLSLRSAASRRQMPRG